MKLTYKLAVGLFLAILLIGCGQDTSTTNSSADDDAPETTQEQTDAGDGGTETDQEAADANDREESETGSGGDTAESKTAEVDEYIVQWTVDGENVRFAVSAPTEGWVAIGFEPRRMMLGANIIIGYVSEGEAVVTDQVGVTATSHGLDVDNGGSDDLVDFSGSQDGGRTEIRFTIPLDSGDTADQPLEPGSEVTVILAYGDRDDLKAYHVHRTSARIQL
jgi:hypothetical protein